MKTNIHPRKRFLFWIFLMLQGHILFAQTAFVKGKITNNKGESMPGVSVLADSATGTISDQTGFYLLKLSPGGHRLSFSMIGMKEKTMSIVLKEGDTLRLDVVLQEEIRQIGVVVVSAGRYEQRLEDVTVSMDVIKPSQVEERNTTTLEDVINQSPSVNIIDGQANIRGGSGWSYGAGSRVLILVDDLPMISADAGDVKWPYLPVENLEQIEIIKGASSALYGSSATNGVINVRTAYPTDTPVTRINFFTGFYDQHPKITLNDTTYDLNWWGKRLQFNKGLYYLHSRKIGSFDLVIGGNSFEDDGYREGENEIRQRINFNTRYRFKKTKGLSCGVNFNTMKTVSTIFFIWQNDTTGAYRPAGGTGAGTSLSQSTTYRTNVDPYVTYVDDRGNAFKLRTRWFETNNVNNTQQNSIGTIYYGELQYQKHIRDQYVFTGGAVKTSSLVRSQLYGGHNGENTAFYAQSDAKFFRKLNLSLGARMEQNNLDSLKDEYTPVLRAGVNYNLLKATYLRASFGQGYRYPSVAEKFVATKVSSLTLFPNPDLTPEKSYSAEVGIMQAFKAGSWNGYLDVAGFYTRYRNMVEFTFSIWDLTKPLFDGIGFKAINIGETRISGVDVTLSANGQTGEFKTTFLAGYTFMEPQAIEFDSLYIKSQHILDNTSAYNAYLGSDSTTFLKYRFSHLAKADVDVSYRKVTLGATGRYNSFMKNIDRVFVSPFFGELISPGVAHYRKYHRHGDFILDARLALQISPALRTSVIVKNVLNYIYMERPTDMQPPRTYTLQVSIEF